MAAPTVLWHSAPDADPNQLNRQVAELTAISTQAASHAQNVSTEPTPPYVRHQGEFRQYMRDIILGVNDGLVSMFLLIMGVVGGGFESKQILLAGITGAVAGAISMALGEYMATKSQVSSSAISVEAHALVQSEVIAGDLELEKEHFQHHRQIELDEVRDILIKELLLSGRLLDEVVEAVGSSDESLLNFMKAFEFGFTEQDDRSPIVAGLASGCLFVGGSLPSVIPFACTSDTYLAFYIAMGLCGVAMFAVGSIKTLATRTNWFWAGMENLTVGAIAAAISYGIGYAYDQGQGTMAV